MNRTYISLKMPGLFAGLALMFLLTWPLAIADAGLVDVGIPAGVLLFQGWGLSLAAVLVTGWTQGWSGAALLLKRLAFWRVNWRWYLIAFLLEPLLLLLAVFAAAAWTGVLPDFNNSVASQLFGRAGAGWYLVLPFFLVDLVTNGEEIGWRGFALPRLQSKIGAVPAAWITGIVWAFWHLPRFIPNWHLWSFALFVCHILAFSVLLAWVYDATGGSLLLVSFMHAASNTAGAFLPVAVSISTGNLPAFAIYAALELLAALLVIVATRPGMGTEPSPAGSKTQVFLKEN